MIKYLYFFLLGLLFFLNSCSDLKKGMGLEKDKPDEFMIRKVNPIEMPPDYQLLPPGSDVKKKGTKVNSESTKSEDLFDQNFKTENTTQSSKTPSRESSLENSILKEINKN